MSPMPEKNSNLEKSILPESPFTKMTYNIQGCFCQGLVGHFCEETFWQTIFLKV
jgi:hypothetical protein